MGIRKTIASGLIAAAHHLQHDRSKEQLIRKTNDVRRKIARFIEPNWHPGGYALDRTTEGASPLAVAPQRKSKVNTMEVSMELTTQAKEQIQIALTQIHADACDLSLDNDVPYHEALSKVFHTLWTKLESWSVKAGDQVQSLVQH